MAAERRPKDPWRSPEERTLLMRFAMLSARALDAPLAAFRLDPPVFRELLRARVLLALRPVTQKSSMSAAAPVIVVMSMWGAGVGTGIVALVARDPRLWVLVSLSVLLFLLAMLLFQVFAGILVDPTDIGVVAAHPIRDRTVLAVRMAELGLYVLVLVATFAAGNVMVAAFGPSPLGALFVYPLLALLAGTTGVGLAALFFAICLRVAGPRHFQRVALWAQILGGVVLFALPQVPRLFRIEQLRLWAEELRALALAWPPYHYAEAFELACGREADVVAAALAVLLPVAAFAATFALASRYFVAGLQGTLGAAEPRSAWPEGAVARVGRRAAPGMERCGYDFAAALSRREPGFLRGVLPQLVMFQVMSLGMGFGMTRDLSLFVPISASFLFMTLPNVLSLSQGSSSPDARIVFDAAPLADGSPILRGGVKALIVQWYVVPALALLCVQLLLGGARILPRSVLALELSALMVLWLSRRFDLHVPFTQPLRFGEMGSRNLAIVLLSGFLIAAVVGVHWALSLHSVALAAGIAACAALLPVLWRRLDGLRPIVPRAR